MPRKKFSWISIGPSYDSTPGEERDTDPRSNCYTTLFTRTWRGLARELCAEGRDKVESLEGCHCEDEENGCGPEMPHRPDRDRERED